MSTSPMRSSGASQAPAQQESPFLTSDNAVKKKYTAAAPLEEALQQSLTSSSRSSGSARGGEAHFGNRNGENVSETA